MQLYMYINYVHSLLQKAEGGGNINRRREQRSYCLVIRHSLDSDTLPQTALDTPLSNQTVNVL